MSDILVIQRQSLIAEKKLPSRSVYARILDAFEYLESHEKISFLVKDESEINDNDIKNAKTLIFSKHNSNRSVDISKLAHSLGKKIVYDLDDYIFSFPKYSVGEVNTEKENNIKTHLKLASYVSISTERLLLEVKKKYPGANYRLIPNGINMKRHLSYLSDKKDSQKIKMVFTNTDKIKLKSFRAGFFEAINELLKKYPNLELDIFSDEEGEMKNFCRYNYLGSVSWFEHKKLLAQGQYSIGIVPLSGGEDPEGEIFHECKSPIKYLEYGGLKIASVYSNVFIYKKVITNGVNGLLVENNKKSWKDALEKLILNIELRIEIGENSCKDVLKSHSIEKSSNKWMELLMSSE